MLIAILIKSSSSCERRDFAKDKFMHFKQYITFHPFLILLLNNPCIQITYILIGKTVNIFPFFFSSTLCHVLFHVGFQRRCRILTAGCAPSEM